MLFLDKYEVHTIPKLWAEYISKLDKGIDEPYINVGDYVIVQDEDYFGNNSPMIEIASKCMYVYQSCKVASNLYFTTVSYNGQDYVLADNDIAIVLKQWR